jgi:glycolate oxidase FAD binding subunit
MAPPPADALAKTGADVRDAGAADLVAGVRPAYVAAPVSAEETAAVMRAAAEHDLSVVARGAGTKLDWGIPPYRCDLVLDLSRMREVVEHAAGDLVVRVEAGCPMSDLAAVLAGAGQRLALDSPVPGATVGGTLATATSGPLRLAYGTARDLLIGVTMVRADGVTASSGGRVVKNVAGYDLGKLLTGSYGTLGVIMSATFRLHPEPPRRAYVRAPVSGGDAAHAANQAVLGAQAVPAAIEYERRSRAGSATITVLLEGGADLPHRAEGVAALLDGAEVLDSPPDGFGAYPADPGAGTLIKLIAPVADLPYALAALDAAAEATGLDPDVRGSSGVGVVYAGLPAGVRPDDAGAFLAALRGALASRDGTAVVLRAEPDVREVVGMWGPVAGLGLMRRIKERFDPGHRLAPGRFAGGI